MAGLYRNKDVHMSSARHFLTGWFLEWSSQVLIYALNNQSSRLLVEEDLILL